MQFYGFELTSGLLALYNIMCICEDVPYKLQIYSQRFVCLFLFIFPFFLCSNIFSESDQLVYGKYIFVNDILTGTFSRNNYLVFKLF